MILDICGALADLWEPTGVKVILDIAPLTWQKDTLYVYPIAPPREEIFETGPTRIQRFEIAGVYITDSGDEARLERDPELAVLLDTKRGDYMRAIRVNEHHALWGSLTSAIADIASPRGLDKRSAAVRVSGWRIVN